MPNSVARRSIHVNCTDIKNLLRNIMHHYPGVQIRVEEDGEMALHLVSD